MNKLIYTASIFLLTVLFSTSYAQTSGVLWIKTFEPGSTSLSTARIDKEALAALDQLMLDSNMEVTFLGAADSVNWVFNGKNVHANISEAWNDAKRLGRARALRARYERGNVGVTHENIAGVKVVWAKKKSQEEFDQEITDIKKENDDLNQKLAKLETDFKRLQPFAETHAANGSTKYLLKESRSYFDWFLHGGFWTWQAGTGSLVTPSIALGIIIDKTSFVLQGGVTPWHISTPEGNQSESFVYIGIKHMKTNTFGISVGAFRGWEFFTDTDNWSFKTTGLSTGIVIKRSVFEFNPMISYSNSNSIFNDSNWKIGTTVGLSISFNEAL